MLQAAKATLAAIYTNQQLPPWTTPYLMAIEQLVELEDWEERRNIVMEEMQQLQDTSPVEAHMFEMQKEDYLVKQEEIEYGILQEAVAYLLGVSKISMNWKP
jgi:hypothetical protein